MGGAQSSADGASARSRRICCTCKSEEQAKLLSQERTEEQNGLPPFPAGSNEDSVIQFSCAIYYASEEEGVMEIDVVRLGSSSGAASVDFATRDSSAKAGVKYAERSGTVVFDPGDTIKVITIPVLNDSAWDATLEFIVDLTNARGAQLGKYLNTCRVKVIDDDFFPTNRFRQEISEGGIEDVPGHSLLREYVKMNLKREPIFWGSVKMMLLDEVKNLYFLLTVYLGMYLTDVMAMHTHADDGEAEERLLMSGISTVARMLGEATGGAEGEHDVQLMVPGHRRDTVLVIGLLYLLPFGLNQLVDNKKVYYGVAGLSRRTLQANLLRKFLNYREDMRAKIEGGEMTMAMVRDVAETVEGGYMKLLVVVQILGKLILAFIFIGAENHAAIIPLCGYPLVMLFFLWCRERTTVKAGQEHDDRQNDLVRYVQDTVNNYRIIADFLLRPFISDTYEAKIQEYNISFRDQVIVTTNNNYLSPWLMTILVGGYIIVGSAEVKTFGGPLSLGAFLATISVFKEAGKEFEEIYKLLSEIQTSFGPLKKVVQLMNYKTDLQQRMMLNRKRRAEGANQRAKARRESTESTGKNTKGEQVYACDLVDIAIDNVCFRYGDNAITKPGAKLEDQQKDVLCNLSMSFRQGRMYAFVGPPREGKATLMRLLGQVILPGDNDGCIFVPPHLRVLHVSSEVHVLQASLLTNIIFNSNLDMIGGMERLEAICRDVGFSEAMMAEIRMHQDGNEEHNRQCYKRWFAQMSHTDYARLNFARALVMNPECMVMHKPAVVFNENESKKIITLIRQHVDEKGIRLPEKGRQHRRPRTVFFTSSTLTGIKLADSVYEVAGGKLTEITKEGAMESHLKWLT